MAKRIEVSRNQYSVRFQMDGAGSLRECSIDEWGLYEKTQAIIAKGIPEDEVYDLLDTARELWMKDQEGHR